MKIEDLKQLADYCKANGLRRAKLGDLEVELSPTGSATNDDVQAFAKALAGDTPSEDEILFWSAAQLVKAPDAAQ